MENLVPLGTGNSRFMKSNIPASTTLAQLIQMLNNGTFPYDIGTINPAGISQQGTPLNKDTLLKDATAALYGLGTDAVPDDVFQKIKKFDVFKVGDTLTTMRTDLGDKWLLCNGAQVNRTDYPELSVAVPADLIGSWTSTRPTSLEYTPGFSCTQIIFDGSTYYFVGNFGRNIHLFKSTDLLTWTDVGGIDSSRGSIQHVYLLYAAGRAVVVFWDNDEDKRVCRYSEAPDTGSWTLGYEGLGSDESGTSDPVFTYLNGYYIFFYYNNPSARLEFWYSPDCVTWNNKILNTGSNMQPCGAAYINGEYYLFAGFEGGVAYSSAENIEDIPVFSTGRTIPSFAAGLYQRFAVMQNENSVILYGTDFVAQSTDLSTFPESLQEVAQVGTTITPDRTIWTLGNYSLGVPSGTTTSSGGISPTVYYFDPQFTRYQVTLPNLSGRCTYQILGAVQIENNYILPYMYLNNSTDRLYLGYYLLDVSKTTLPSISLDDVTRTYIKVSD